MSVAVCRSPASGFESILMLACKETLETTLPRQTPPPPPPPPSAQFDIWASIQAQSKAQKHSLPPYIPPSIARSSSSGLLNENSLQICTESLGSESGSNDFFSSDDESQFFSSITTTTTTIHKQEAELETEETLNKSTNTRSVNYHCSISRKSSSTPRSFPPPLPSISRRDGPCFQMRPHRIDGRLVVEAVAVPSQNYLHAERHNGRLLLSFINTTTSYPSYKDQEVVEVEEEEEEEEEVEVVDRGTMVEVKVSTQPQQRSKVHRSSIVINKFVSCNAVTHLNSNFSENVISCTPIVTPNLSYSETTETTVTRPVSPVRRLQVTATTTAAAAAVAASSVSEFSEESQPSITITTDNKLLFASKRRNREELLHDMRRCSQLKKPLFIWEPCCIATSS